MKKISILLFVLLLIISNVSAEILYNHTVSFYVNDFANVLSNNVEENIFNIGRNIDTKTTAQLVVVTVPNMDGDYIESYANKLFNKWGIGNKEKDNGVLLILALEERDIRIEVGYGLEGAINDAKAGRILDNYAVSALKSDDFDTAILETVKQLQGEIYAEYNVDISSENPDFIPIDQQYDVDSKYIFFTIGVFIFLVIITKGKILEWIFWMMMFSNGRSGGGRFGGGGGRFGGGGGSSGGGGASRRF